MHSLGQHLLHAFSVPGTVLGTGVTVVEGKTPKDPLPHGAHILLGETDHMQEYKENILDGDKY